MMDTEERKLFKKTIKKWGKEFQRWMLVEELGELLQTISKVERKVNAKSVEELAEEIADVKIMLMQMEVVYDIEKPVYEQFLMKMKRLKEKTEVEE